MDLKPEHARCVIPNSVGGIEHRVRIHEHRQRGW